MLRLYQQLERETADFYAGNPHSSDADRLKCLERIEELQRRIEEPAEAAELVIWRELSKQGVQSGKRSASSFCRTHDENQQIEMPVVVPFPANPASNVS